MTSLKVWANALRMPFFTATIIPIAIGFVIAWNSLPQVSWLLFFLLLLSGIFIHAGINLSNDFYDHLSGNDQINNNLTPFSGGSRVIQDKLISPKKILYVAITFFVLGSLIGIYLNSRVSGNTILIMGFIGIFLGFFYTAYPFRLGYRGIGEVLVALGFGPLLVLSSYYLQAGSFSFEAFFISLPIGILIALVLTINSFHDFKADKKVNKKTLVVILGKKNSSYFYVALLIVTYLIMVYGISKNIIPLSLLIVFFTLPLSLFASRTVLKNYDKKEELIPSNKLTIGLHFLFGVLIVVSYVLDKVF
ncbi:1,4-dihydroxy-2-naphthoate octaprenyltransferase [Candidatus Woesearchaeota archaeon]|nr:1,4-dihydroxy-2-naphthoate octaprenyltransferase [Candidatus Woesearchaeota archaeon]